MALVTFTGLAAAAAYGAERHLPFPVLVDADRDAYRAFGLGRGSVWRVWGAKAAHRYWEIIRAEGIAGLHRPTEDPLQLGGDFVVAPDGRLAYGFWGEGPDDRPSVDELVAAVRQAAA